METRSQKRKREIEETSKRVVNTIKSNKENIDIKKCNAPLITKKLTILLDRINLSCCQQEHCHEKSENGAEIRAIKQKREVSPNVLPIKSQQVEEGLITAVKKPKSKQKVYPTNKVRCYNRNYR